MNKISRYHTQWAAQFFVAAELSRRGYLVSLTHGNAPTADLLVESPKGIPFPVEVKGQRTKGYWLIKPPTRPLENRFYVLVFIPTENVTRPVAPRYFVMTAKEANTLRQAYRDRITHQKGPWPEGEWDGFNWGDATDYENRWQILPS